MGIGKLFDPEYDFAPHEKLLYCKKRSRTERVAWQRSNVMRLSSQDSDPDEKSMCVESKPTHWWQRSIRQNSQDSKLDEKSVCVESKPTLASRWTRLGSTESRWTRRGSTRLAKGP